MAIYNPKPITWRELRPLRVRFMVLAFILDIILWYLFYPGFHMFSSDISHGFWGVSSLVNIICFFIDTIFITESIVLICDQVRRFAKGQEMHIMRTLGYKIVVFLCALLLSWLLSLFYQAIGWETSDDGLFTTLTCSLVAIVIGESYFAYTYTYEIGIAGERMSALQNKIIMNNHFELNTLFQLKALIRKDPEMASSMIDSMSEYHKYVVSSNRHTTSPVSKEIEFFNAYIQIMEIRYPEGFKIEIDDAIYSIDKKVPIMSFQVLGENVFKHNAIDKDNKIIIKIYPDDNGKSISFENNLVPVIGEIPSSKTGLKLIQEFYTVIGLSIKITKTDRIYKVTLPLI